MASILGPELVLFYSSAFVKRPRDGKHVDWHQDNTYWSTVTGHDVVTVWLALDDVDEGNACMQVIPGSHRGHDAKSMKEVAARNGAMLTQEVDVTEAEIATAVPVVLKAGAFSIHDSFLLHGSGPNDSDRRRAGYTIRYGYALTTAIRQAEHRYGNHPPLPIYYVRGTGAGMRDGYVDARSNGSWAVDHTPWT